MGLIDIDYFSKSLNRKVRFKVFVPSKIDSMLVLLHGAGDNCEAWTNYTNVIRYNKNHLLVFPSGDMSFYLNRDKGEQYTDFIVELIDFCFDRFNIATDKLYIAGNSMGGYGTLHVLHSLKDRVHKAGLFSPAIDLNKEFIKKYQDTTLKNNVVNYYEEFDESLADKIFFYCGINDYLYDGNKRFSEQYNIPLKQDMHDHTWDAWDEVVQVFIKEIDALSDKK